jgi:AAA domain, putative AbiEii toxin, Type IV TA system
MSTSRLTIKNFAQIEEVDLRFGDLTVLVGAQGTGKSLALQWLKVAMDGKAIAQELVKAGQPPREDNLIDLLFGMGMGSAWRDDSEITFDRKKLTRQSIPRIGGGAESVFFIPAHRAMLISDGWAAPFQKLSPDTPAVARLFSDTLYRIFAASSSDQLFPLGRVLKREYLELIDQAVFHGGTVRLEEDQQHSKRLKLRHGDAALPFMTWTAGQREFTPLLLGLYYLLSSFGPKSPTVIEEAFQWVVIEEPEMGLHPQALTAFLLLMLEVLSRGYRVVLSTHSPHVLTAMWMLRRLRETQARPQLLCEAFGVAATTSTKKVAAHALRADCRVHLLEFEGTKVRSKDISSLDPGSEDEDVAGWGGLAGFSERFGEAVHTRPGAIR